MKKRTAGIDDGIDDGLETPVQPGTDRGQDRGSIHALPVSLNPNTPFLPGESPESCVRYKSGKAQEGCTIGTLAREGRVHVETIRYYERRGLLPRPEKPPEGYRRYPPDSLKRLVFIRKAQSLGFTLSEIGELLTLRAGRDSCEAVRRKAENKKAGIEAKIMTLEQWKNALESLIQQCKSGRKPESDCPILDALSTDNLNSESFLG